MPLKLTIASLNVESRQRIRLAVGHRLVSVALDHRFNNCQLATLEDGAAEKEDVDLLMLRVGDVLAETKAQHVGSFKDNAGMVHVFCTKVPMLVKEEVALTEGKK